MSEYHEGISEDIYATAGELESLATIQREQATFRNLRNVVLAVGSIGLAAEVYMGTDVVPLVASLGATGILAGMTELLRRT